ncbi:MAG: cytochrome c oxidase subunit II [Rhodospirillales bacterium]|nr:cytochrome c oxidase subunit II [Rhodospirillales bacterium]
MLRKLPSVAGLVVAAILTVVGAAFADQPHPWQIDLQPAASTVAEQVHEFNYLITVIIVGISVFVLALMAYVAWRFNAKRNPVPSRRSHNTALEVIWTALPVLILVVIAVPSLRLLYVMDRNPDADMTIKAVGHQWYWSYEYPDHDGFTFDSIMVPDNELKPGQPRLLAVDNEVVLPIETDVRILVTSEDVIHSWAMPSFGIKTDAVPGRVNETWVRILREGTYYGQCSELCGVNHAYMPIAIRAVSKEAFDEWTAEAKEKYARADGSATRLAGRLPATTAR